LAETALTILMGNEAVALSLLAAGAQAVAAYPGTPSSEILEAAAQEVRRRGLRDVHVEWSVNEKVAFETAYAASMSGKRSAVAMKQVGLNVASDPFLSAAYMGVVGGMVIVAADDPGPHSSQTEQDSRLFGLLAKVPSFDPSSPGEAGEFVERAFDLSEKLRIPVLLRPVTRVCHAREPVSIPGEIRPRPRAAFQKEPGRWTATPRFRHTLHAELERKLDQIRRLGLAKPRLTGGNRCAPRAVLALGIPWAHVTDLVAEEPGLGESLALYKVDLAYPVDTQGLAELAAGYREVLVLEETDAVVELQFSCRDRVRGRLDGSVPRAGELTPEVVAGVVASFARTTIDLPDAPNAPGRRPSLCAGCGHRPAFYALRRAFPKGILTGDIGCYTLGMNLGAVDAFICMGGGIGLAAGLYHAYRTDGLPDAEIPPIAATIGDSTFFHAGMAPLLNAIHQGARILCVVLDNGTTAMTGQQPTAGTGARADGTLGPAADIATIARGLGARWVEEADPYDRERVLALLRDGHGFCRGPEGSAAVLILKRPCVQSSAGREAISPVAVEITDLCDGCGACVKLFECPAFQLPEGAERLAIDDVLCTRCGQCIGVCPKGAIVEAGAER
jgi:indolepyruvate ferredoxin oxidoreductase alpha subunit